jgi:hypothetical protein
MTVFYWQHFDPAIASIATLCMLAGLALVYRSWRWQKRAGLIPGWILLLASLIGWSLAGTAWIGLPVGASALMLLVIAWIAFQGQWPSRVATTNGVATTQKSGRGITGLSVAPGAWQRGLIRLLVAGPIAAAFATATGLLLAQAIATVNADRLFAERLLVTMLWTGGMAWACLARRPALPAGCMVFITVTALAALLIP